METTVRYFWLEGQHLHAILEEPWNIGVLTAANQKPISIYARYVNHKPCATCSA